MAAEDGSNEVSDDDAEDHCSTFIVSSLHESAEQKPGRPRKHEGLWYSLLAFLIANDKVLNKNLATSFTSTSPLVLLPAIQTASLLLGAIYLKIFIM